MLFARLSESGLPRRLIQLAREEDLGSLGDITSLVSIEATAVSRAAIVAREAGVLAGVRVIPMVLQAFAPDVAFEARAADGYAVAKGHVVGVLSGPTRQVLAAERTLLNFLGRLSGIATMTARFVEAAAEGAAQSGGGGRGKTPLILDTRKTTPGMRVLEKYAVACGGGACHRIGLFDAVLIKDNHLAGVSIAALPGFLQQASAKARALALEGARAGGKGFASAAPVASLFMGGSGASAEGATGGVAGAGANAALAFVECEVDSLEQLDAILAAGGCGLDIVLLDNMSPEELRRAVERRDRSGVAIELEASGGVSLETVGAIAATGVDRISAGQLTHSVRCLDVALDFVA